MGHRDDVHDHRSVSDPHSDPGSRCSRISDCMQEEEKKHCR
ncbi:uncharacterized, partial [Tachysurus ichikawai]